MNLIAIFTALGLVLRFGVLRTQGTLWFDEIFSVHFASLPLDQAYPLMFQDVHPPLYQMLLRGWLAVAGDSDLAARLLSVLLGVAAIPAVAAVAGRVFGPRAAAVAAFFVAVSPIAIFHSAEARMYQLLILLSALALSSFLRLIEPRQEGKPDVRPWALLAGAMLLTHAFALASFLGAVAFGAYRFRRDRPNFRRFLSAAAAAVSPFLLWVVYAGASRLGGIGSEWQMQENKAATVGARFVDFFVAGAADWQRSLLFAVLALALVSAIFIVKKTAMFAWSAEAEKDMKVWALVAWSAAPFFLFMPVFTQVTKYFFSALPAVMALTAGGAVRLIADGGPFGKKKAWIAAATLYAAIVAAPLMSLLATERYRSDAAAGFIMAKERPGDAIFSTWLPMRFQLQRYYRGALPFETTTPFGQMSDEEFMVKHAGQAMGLEQVKAEIARAEARFADVPRVFIVTGVPELTGGPIEKNFLESGWTIEERFSANEYSPVVFLLRNPKGGR
jgi:uncharacterized membrane protein